MILFLVIHVLFLYIKPDEDLGVRTVSLKPHFLLGKSNIYHKQKVIISQSFISEQIFKCVSSIAKQLRRKGSRFCKKVLKPKMSKTNNF